MVTPVPPLRVRLSVSRITEGASSRCALSFLDRMTNPLLRILRGQRVARLWFNAALDRLIPALGPFFFRADRNQVEVGKRIDKEKPSLWVITCHNQRRQRARGMSRCRI